MFFFPYKGNLGPPLSLKFFINQLINLFLLLLLYTAGDKKFMYEKFLLIKLMSG